MLFVSLVVFWVCAGTTVAYSNDVLIDGDVVFGGLFVIQNYKDNDCNGDMFSSIQVYEAVRWFFRELNRRSYVQNITFGLHAFKFCGHAPFAVKATLEMLQAWENKSKLTGLLGPARSSAAQSVSRLLSSLPQDQRLPQIISSATAVTLSDKTVYKNLYRVIVPDGIQVEIILQLLIHLKWNYIAIIYEADAYGTEAATALKHLADKHDICVPVFTAIDTSKDAQETFRAIGVELEEPSRSPVLGLVFIGQAATAEKMFKNLNIDRKQFQIIGSETLLDSQEYMMDSANNVYKRAKGLLTSSPPQYDMVNFKKHWESIHKNASLMREAIENNDWMLKYMEKQTECSLAGGTISEECLEKSAAKITDDKLSIYVSYALMAAASFAKTYKNLHQTSCSQNNNCDISHESFLAEMAGITVDPGKDFEKELEGFRLKFGFRNGEIHYPEPGNSSQYSVYNYQQCPQSGSEFCYIKIGDFIDGKLYMINISIKSYSDVGTETHGPVQAQCQAPYTCSSCHTESVYGKILHLPGDYYIIGLVPVHNRGDNTYQCGQLRTGISVDLVESLSYAVEMANEKRDQFAKLLGDKTVGLVLLDTCNTPFLTRERVMKFFRGDLKISETLNSSQIKDRVIGLVGPYASSNSVPFSQLATDIDKLYIAYASTSSRLSDRKSFPNFMRTCSPDNKQAEVIMNLAKVTGGKYVQIIYTDEEYGIAGRESLERAAKKNGVCIAQSIPVEEATESSFYRGYVSELRKFRSAKLVIIFVRSHVTAPLLTALNGEIKSGEFVFIGGESWGKRSPVLQRNLKLRGSLTVSQELPRNHGFQNYFRHLKLETSRNPWLQSYLELKYKCYYPKSFNKKNDRRCETMDPDPIAATTEFDTWVPFVINAVSTLVIGFNKTLHSKCFGFSSICSEYTTADLINNVKSVSLDIYDVGSKVRVFDDNGEGIVGYVISHVIKEDENLVYKKVGTTENGAKFSLSDLDPAQRVDFTSACPNDVECGVCSRQLGNANDAEGLSGEDSKSSDSTRVIGLAVALGVFILLVLLLAGMLFWCKKKRKSSKEPDYLTVNPDNSHPYITAIPERCQSNKTFETETSLD